MRAEALLAAAGAGTGQPALEALDATARIDQLLLAGVERMAVGADLHVHVALRGTRHELVPAGAAHGGLCVFGMDLGLHSAYQDSCLNKGRRARCSPRWPRPPGRAD